MQQKPVIFLAFANEMESASRYLRGLVKEKALIRETLERASEAGLCELIVESNATVGSIINTFQKPRFRDRIAIFHYGGHADGYQLLLEGLEGSNVVAHGEGLVSFFARQRGLQLIFLNGCSTQEQAMDLVKAGVPAVIGTSHVVSDEVATQLAERFYRGLANGATIQRSWKEAEDEMLIIKGKGTTRSLFLGGIEEVPEFFPWDLYVRDGSEIVRNWNLPEAVDNPLFGLPEPPLKHLPEKPYRFLERYTEAHSEIFFGRSYYIRDLYDRVTNRSSAPVLLLYGQSGVGKSSLLDAGLFPRLEQSCEVIYIRRDRQKGLLGTLKAALGSFGVWDQNQELSEKKRKHKSLARQQRAYQDKIEQIEYLAQGLDAEAQTQLQEVLRQLKQNPPSQASQEDQHDEFLPSESTPFTLLEAWQSIEAQSQQALIVILDQAEEAFSQPNPYQPDEWELFLEEVRTLFLDPKDMPRGKLVLSYRKEYHPEIEEFFKALHIPREQVFLKQLTKKDLREIATGLTRSNRLTNQYRLSVEEELPDIIADDLLEDRDSPIAPVLQILLTKMWHQVEEEEYRYFTVDLYQSLRKEGILMGDFLDQQLEDLEETHRDWVQSGWVLDLLFFHTTSLGTAGSKTREEISQRYSDKQKELPALMEACRRLYLLAEGGNGGSVLAHDTLAPLVQERFRNSDLPGQRAARLMEHKIQEYQSDPATTLDETDLAIVEAGRHGMKVWSEEEIALVKASQKRRKRARALRKNLLILGAIAALMVLGFGIFARMEGNKAIISKNEAEAQKELAESRAQQLIESSQAEKDARQAAEISARAAQDSALSAEIARRKAEEKEREANLTAGELQKSQVALLANNDSLEKARIDADNKRKEAEQANQAAEDASQAAKRSQYLSLANALATKALVAEDTMKILLAAQACHFYDSLDGPDYDPALYRAMYEALKTKEGSNYQLLPKDPSSPRHNDAIRAIAFLNPRHFFTAGAQGQLLKWDWQSAGQSEAFHKLKDGIPRSIAIHPAGNILLVSTEEAVAKNLNALNQPASLQRFGLHKGKTFDVIPLGKEEGFVSIGEDQRLMWSNATGNTRMLDSLPTKVHALALHPDGHWLVGAGEDGKLWLWDVKQAYERVSTGIDVLTQGVALQAVAFSPDGKYLFMGDAKGHILGLTWKTQSVFAQFQGHQTRISDLAFRPDSRQMASASWDKTVRLWNLDQINDLPIILSDHSDWVMSIAYAPDGETLLVGLRNGQLKYWPTRPDLMQDALFDQLHRSLTPTEWRQYLGEEIPLTHRVKPKS